MKVVFVSGPRTGDEMEVDRELIVGREESDLEIEDTTVSRRHAAFRPTDDERVEVEDLGSTNGTFVNGARIVAPVTLQPGDFVSIGNSTFEVRGDWRSTETEAISIPAQVGTPAEDEDELPTSQLSMDEVKGTRSQIPRTWIAAAAVALLIVVGLIFVFSNGDDEAVAADDICRRELRALGDVPLRGPRIQENARRIVSVRVQLRKELGEIAGEGDQDAFAAFLRRYAETNGHLRRLSNLPERAKPPAVRRAATAVREAAAADARAATSAGLEECGGLPV